MEQAIEHLRADLLRLAADDAREQESEADSFTRGLKAGGSLAYSVAAHMLRTDLLPLARSDVAKEKSA